MVDSACILYCYVRTKLKDDANIENKKDSILDEFSTHWSLSCFYISLCPSVGLCDRMFVRKTVANA